MQSTSSGASSGVGNSVLPKIRLTLVELKSYKLGESDITSRQATHQQFSEFASSLVPLTAEEGAKLDHWTVEERRDFLNWCLENDVLRIEDDRLMLSVPPDAPVEKEG